ncbi:leucyl/phenylalanyl-tRNA--protein transferase [Brevibacterium sp. BDJS002]|uniref:Leucyl/phenylalanyl-tRNA--protein transferase n=1 Tax=Brevibacterium aurantiacum TaxID=273384 RepID=A0A2A3ZDE9_BREAU|nr:MULTISPECIES: leucyl/phenylalanyl-tRNA--protein transferase [Brevibacterium]MDN5550878.1 leucyl/phenylalanyl-tRNA--protein transferase [Brevibacterium sp.]MDN5736383.1 leucyl/phenylalanyl-tRNA--protein transferase [Brevibacterium aurantiacum]MDN5774190.1 leucyl/phenylalanyl-tRNA--protein transferase [Brevibacterium aurantiacum]MDN6377960.1 leucyl/phenylalanyl-tRNA--protein transferase [Brevibacterium aurantiacum]PCC49481.1 leucyl/phenylalanyl-tRNA--protein transferase [Brevibacterium aurant
MDLEDLRAVSYTATQAQVLSSYRAGLFPMGIGSGGTGRMGWWGPRRRGVLLPGDLKVSKSLRKSMRHFECSVNTDFEHVIRACADPSRPGSWITEDIISLYLGLHKDGWAHSVEIRSEGILVGGLYGVAMGSFFAGESMFHTRRDASKAALVHLVSLFDETLDNHPSEPGAKNAVSSAPTSIDNDDDHHRWLIDTQWQTSHLASLGVSEISGLEYSTRLDSALRGDRCQVILNK